MSVIQSASVSVLNYIYENCLFFLLAIIADKSLINLFLQIMFIILHVEKGTPFETPDQGKFRYLTVWEQLDYGVQFSASRKFLTIVPIVL